MIIATNKAGRKPRLWSGCRGPGVSLALGLAAAILPLRGSDPVPVVQASQDDSIAAAKRQLDAVKSSSRAANSTDAGQSKPQLGLPQLPAAPELPAVAVVSPATEPDEQSKKSANWLVDAMMKDPGDPSGLRSRRDGFAGDQKIGPTQLTRGESRTEQVRSENDVPAGESRRVDDKQANPLKKYLADWMTPQDYTLLRRTMESSPISQSLGRAQGYSPTPNGGETDATGPASGDFKALNGVTGAQEVPRNAPEPNPYLEPLVGAQPTSPAPGSTTAPVNSAPTSTLTPLVAPETAPSKPSVPDFVKPTSDEKYFKPLKRF